MVGVLRNGYEIPFRVVPPLSEAPIFVDSYSPHSIKGRALEGGGSGPLSQRCGGACVSLSVVLQPHVCGDENVSGWGGREWRPIIDLSTFNLSVVVSKF